MNQFFRESESVKVVPDDRVSVADQLPIPPDGAGKCRHFRAQREPNLRALAYPAQSTSVPFLQSKRPGIPKKVIIYHHPPDGRIWASRPFLPMRLGSEPRFVPDTLAPNPRARSFSPLVPKLQLGHPPVFEAPASRTVALLVPSAHEARASQTSALPSWSLAARPTGRWERSGAAWAVTKEGRFKTARALAKRPSLDLRYEICSACLYVRSSLRRSVHRLALFRIRVLIVTPPPYRAQK
jgi:hypothetical protein